MIIYIFFSKEKWLWLRRITELILVKDLASSRLQSNRNGEIKETVKIKREGAGKRFPVIWSLALAIKNFNVVILANHRELLKRGI